MTATFDDLLSAFFLELGQTVVRYSPLIKQAEDAGQPRLARLFRAVVASEIARARLLQTGMTTHANEPHDYYVCPHCGLVFVTEAPEKCPVDDTPGIQFEEIR